MAKNSTVVLTERMVSNLKPPADGGATVIWDGRAPGLGLRVSRTSKRWLLRLLQDGKRLSRTLGTHPAMSLAQARALVDEARDRREAGEPALAGPKLEGVADRPGGKAKPITGAMAWEMYFSTHVEPRLVRPHETQAMYRAKLEPALGGAIMGRLTRADLLKVLDHLRANHTPSAAASASRLLKAWINWCADRQMCPPGIASRLRVENVGRRERVLTLAEVKRVLDAADKMGKRPGAVIRLAWLTAARIREVAGARWSEVQTDDDGQVWLVIGKERSKSRRAHRVPLAPAAVAIVEKARGLSGDSAFLFPSLRAGDERAYDPGNLPAQLRRRAKLDDFRVHDLRRSAASHLLNRGMSPDTVKALLGHSSASLLGVTHNYSGSFEWQREKVAAVALLEELIGSTPKKEKAEDEDGEADAA